VKVIAQELLFGFSSLTWPVNRSKIIDSTFEGRTKMKKTVSVAVTLAVVGILTGASQPVLKNKKLRNISIKLEKELTLGENPGGQTALFQSIRSFRVDALGNIYVLDMRAPKLIKFDSRGNVIFTIGRKGQGPGEFMVPTMMELGKNNSILVYDLGNRRLSYFSAETGGLLEEKSTARVGRLFRVDDDSQGFFYGYQILYEPGKKVLVISKFSPSLEPIKDILRVEYNNLENEVKPYAPSLLFRVLSDDGLLVANDGEYKFYWHDAKGSLMRTALTDYRPVTFTSADKERYLKAFTEDGGPPPKDQVFVFPDKYPPIEHMITDDHDNIFVRTYDADKEGRHYYEAFSKNGKPLGRFPLSFNVSCVVGNKMYSLERDENGFDQICRYRYKIVK
jgi:hypothetical protein